MAPATILAVRDRRDPCPASLAVFTAMALLLTILRPFLIKVAPTCRLADPGRRDRGGLLAFGLLACSGPVVLAITYTRYRTDRRRRRDRP
jgi:hypothetical protein